MAKLDPSLFITQEIFIGNPRFVELRGVDVTFGEGPTAYQALSGIDLSIDRGQFVSIIGHSGCGKSTLLNLVAGLTFPSRGQVTVEGETIKGPGLDRAVVFQSHSLLPWLTVTENVKLAVDSAWPGTEKGFRADKTAHYVELVHLSSHAHKKPGELSGGMRQRVGIARAFASRPKVLLLDEPFGALDALTRSSMQDELLSIMEASRKTVIMITHDVDEAVYLSDRIVLMSNGPRAHVARVVDVNLPRPRTREALLRDAAYAEIRRDLLSYLMATRLAA